VVERKERGDPSSRACSRFSGAVLGKHSLGVVALAALIGSLLPGLSIAQVFTEFSIPASAAIPPWDITPGPDGALWFTGRGGGGGVGRIATSGVINSFGDGFTSGIAAGSDGALWFGWGDGLEHYSIRRITTAGVISDFPIGGPTGGITAGPDGALWFTGGGDPIGRITTTSRRVSLMIAMATSAKISVTRGPMRLARGD